MTDFSTVYNAVKNNTVYADNSGTLNEAISLLNQVKTIYTQNGVPTTALSAAISQLSGINLTTALAYQEANTTKNLEIYRMYIEVEVNLGTINKYDTMYRYDDFFGSLDIPSKLKALANDRLDRLNGNSAIDVLPEILPSDSVWLSLVELEVQDIQNYADALSSLDEEQAFTDALSVINDATTATSLLSYMDTSYGLALMSTLTTGDVKTIVDAKIAENNANNGYSDSVDSDTPVSDDSTPFYEIINDRTP